MNILVFGATGMLGQGVLRECLAADDVAQVQTVGRRATHERHAKLRELVHADLWHCAPIETQLASFDACFYCLGVSAVGMAEKAYVHVTYALTCAVARTLVRLNPQMTFVFISAAGADGTEHGRVRWARIKGRTENALLALPFKGVFVLRPGLIQPLHGARSSTAAYRFIYAALRPLWPVLRWCFPKSIVTTEMIGRAMLNIARRGAVKAVFEAADIIATARDP